jgi:hypothetical protein
MLVGLVVGRDIVRAPVLVEADSAAIVALIAPALQLILTGNEPRLNEEKIPNRRSSQ